MSKIYSCNYVLRKFTNFEDRVVYKFPSNLQPDWPTVQLHIEGTEENWAHCAVICTPIQYHKEHGTWCEFCLKHFSVSNHIKCQQRGVLCSNCFRTPVYGIVHPSNVSLFCEKSDQTTYKCDKCETDFTGKQSIIIHCGKIDKITCT